MREPCFNVADVPPKMGVRCSDLLKLGRAADDWLKRRGLWVEPHTAKALRLKREREQAKESQA